MLNMLGYWRRYDRGTGDQWDEEHNNVDHNSEFGFVTMDKPHTLRSFAAYADWMKALHFSEPPPKVRLRVYLELPPNLTSSVHLSEVTRMAMHSYLRH